jgi:hypothetical protein
MTDKQVGRVLHMKIEVNVYRAKIFKLGRH